MKKMAMKNTITWLCLLSFFPLLQVGCVKKKDQFIQDTPKINVLWAPIAMRNLNDEVELSAEIEGYEMAELVSRIEGYIDKVTVDIGDRVEKDQVLAVLRVPEITAEVQRRMKLVEKAKSDLASRQAELKQTESQMAEQNAILQLRQLQLKTQTSLVDLGSIKKEKQDEAQYAVESVLASLKRSLADIEAANAHVSGAIADVAVAESEVTKAQALASYLEITAPFAGLITQRHVDPGALVRPADRGGSPLLKIESVDRVRVVLYLPSEDAAKLDIGDKVVLRGIAGAATVDGFPGSISRFAKSFQRGSRMMRAEVDLNNPADPKTGKRLLNPGDYGKVKLTLTEFPGIAIVPVEAVGQSEQGSFVMLLDKENRCQKRLVDVMIVTTTTVDNTSQEVAGIVGKMEEIKVGQRVIIKDLDKFEDGDELTNNKYSIEQ